MTDDLDAVAARYYENPPDDEAIEDRVVRWIMPKIIGWCSGRVLEMGYGAGRTTEMLHAAGLDLTVVEGSHVLWTRACEAFPDGDVTFLCSDFEDFHTSVKYDTVLCLHVLEHVADPVELLRRVRGWLKPGGRLICVVPNAYSWHRLLGSVMTGLPVATPSERDLLVGHVRVFGPGDLDATVIAAGFELDWMTDGEDPDGMAPWFGWFHKSLPNAMLLGCTPEVIDGLCALAWGSEEWMRNAANIGVIARAV